MIISIHPDRLQKQFHLANGDINSVITHGSIINLEWKKVILQTLKKASLKFPPPDDSKNQIV